MEQLDNIDAKDRILNASIQLFSQKGYDATRVNEIAHEANVNKALIYYYFKSKEEILDHLVESLINNATTITMDFIHSHLLLMIKDGLLDIEPDRFHFINKEAMQSYLNKVNAYQHNLLEYMLKNRQLIRILVLESLKNGRHHNDLFRFLDFFKESKDNPIYDTIWNADKDFSYPDMTVLYKFFYMIIPLVNFVSYFDDYLLISNKDEQELRKSFVNCYQLISASMISGNDILLI
jgi:AcrR family transcriptional regulator